MITVLFAAKSERWQEYETPLKSALQSIGVMAHVTTEADAADVDYIVYAPNSDVQDFTPFVRCKAVLNLWAGVEDVAPNPTLTQPLCRMVDPGLTAGMVEWVTGHILRHHLELDRFTHNPNQDWDPTPPPLASERPVTILGAGALGAACGAALAGLGFPVHGWSNSEKSFDFMSHTHGTQGLEAALTHGHIQVLLLPYTPATENILNAEAFSKMPRGVILLNPGRGPLVDDNALLTALDTEHIRHATLDVFRTEPLPQDHPFWTHPKITVTPHIASVTRANSASKVIAENIHRGEMGLPFLHLVDRNAGY